jgi:hypothetical protein
MKSASLCDEMLGVGVAKAVVAMSGGRLTAVVLATGSIGFFTRGTFRGGVPVF